MKLKYSMDASKKNLQLCQFDNCKLDIFYELISFFVRRDIFLEAIFLLNAPFCAPLMSCFSAFRSASLAFFLSPASILASAFLTNVRTELLLILLMRVRLSILRTIFFADFVFANFTFLLISI